MSDTAPDPVLVAEFPKNRRETIRVCLTEYQGNSLIDIRAYYPTADGMRAGKGISLQRSQIITLRKALQAAERALKQDPTASNGQSSPPAGPTEEERQ